MRPSIVHFSASWSHPDLQHFPEHGTLDAAYFSFGDKRFIRSLIKWESRLAAFYWPVTVLAQKTRRG